MQFLYSTLGTILALFLYSFLPTYFSKKGENLATKEDIAEITDRIEAVKTEYAEALEGVKAQYAILIEGKKASHQLRLAAIDRRLQAHQEAFTHWREVLACMHTQQLGVTITKCQKWWEEHCLYLEPEVREAFVSAYSAASVHQTYTQNRADAALVQSNWATFTRFPEVLFAAVQLPAFSSSESKAVGLDNP